jgi:hypothetical protein
LFSRYNEYNPNGGAGIFRFNGRFSGFDQADYILGLLSSFQQNNGEIEFRRLHYQSLFIGDGFRATSHLTLTFGLRWEPFTGVTDLLDREDQFIQAMYQQKATSPHFVNAPPGLFYPGDKLPNGYVIPKAGTECGLRYFSPRVGFAWDVTGNGKTSIRGGYGIYFDTPEAHVLNEFNDRTPFSFSVQFLDGQFDTPYAGRQQFNVFPYAGDFNPKTPYQLPFNADVLEQQFKLPYTQNWNLTLERTLGSDWLLRVGYVGTKSTHLMVGYDQNAPIYNFSLTLAQNQATIDQRRSRPEYSNMFTLGNPLGQDYNGLQTSINRRFTHGLTVLGGYTLSKNIDYTTANAYPTSVNVVDPFDFGRMRGVADSDHTHRFAGSFVWELPDPGKALQSKAVSIVLGHWQMSGIVTLQTGSPFSIFSSGDRAAGATQGPTGNAFADLVGPLTLTGGSRGQQVARYFNTAAVAQAAPGTFGTLGRNILRDPSFRNTDLSVSRAFPLPFRDGMKAVFRTEFFNLFNRPQIGFANAGQNSWTSQSIGSTTFGRITSTLSPPRILQLSLKMEF